MRTMMRMTKLGLTLGAVMMTARAVRRSMRQVRRARRALEDAFDWM